MRKIKSLFKPSVGKLLALLMAAYFIFTFISLNNRTEVNYYEVEEGGLVKEHVYTGLILREESVVNAEAGGTVYFFVADGRKAAKGSRIYALDSSGNVASYLSQVDTDDLSSRNSTKFNEILGDITSYSRSFDDADYNLIYDINSFLSRNISEYASLSVFSQTASEMEAAGIYFDTYYTDQTGTVCFYTDGYEDISADLISDDLFDISKYSKTTVTAGELIGPGTPVYKLITDENWQIAFELSDDDRNVIEEGKQYRISFSDKGFTAVSDISFIRGIDGRSFGLIGMDSYLVQFTGDRFVNFEVVTNNVSGLKIPDKSITTKNFYVIPTEYYTEDDLGNGGFRKVSVGENGNEYDFIVADIYYKDDEYCYIDCNDLTSLKEDDYVGLEDSDGTNEKLYQIRSQLPLTGAYNINKGYTVFRKVEVLESANGYSIVKKGTEYGLAPYDHIVLDASTVEEGELLYR